VTAVEVTERDCELCSPDMVLLEDALAYVRFDNNSLSRGHVLVVPRRHVASFFDMTFEEKTCVLALLDRAKARIENEFTPDGYNIGVNIGRAGGQSRMHVHVHLIPRYDGDVADPRGGIRSVLANRQTPHR
jgi:diadenosine tetraphosphate (Ap4A) HIT family hydrolase